MVITSLLSGVVVKLDASSHDIGGPTIVGSDATGNLSNFTPRNWPKKASVKLNLAD